MKKLIEMLYPYVLSVVIFVLFKFVKNSLYQSKNINDALDAVITVSSLIIGFLGAVLPVIMSMKNDSILVKYVFKDKLFLKYIKQTLIVGVLVIIVSVTVYFRDQYKDTWYEKWNIPILVYMLSCFLLCTYRCFSNMLNLIFMNDVELFSDDDSFRRKTTSELEFEKECEKR